LVIQGKSLDEFVATDSFQLGYKTNGGTFTFTAIHDGLFNTKLYSILDNTDGQDHTNPIHLPRYRVLLTPDLKLFSKI